MNQRKGVGFFDRVLDIGRLAAMAMIIFLMLGVSARVGMRYAFGNPFNWVIDVSTILQLYLTFLAAAWLLREEGHISIDIVFGVLKPKSQFLLQVIISIICALVCGVITVFGVIETWTHWKLDLYADMPLEPPKWILIVIIPLGTLLLFIQFLRRTRTFMKKYRGEGALTNERHRVENR